jgi:cell division protein FtsL
MAAWADNAARAHAPAAPRARPRPRPAAKPASRPRTRQRVAPVGGVLWIALLAALLGGIVALNVAVLQANVRLDELAKERAELQGANAALSSQLSTAGATPQVEALARQRLGLEPATPEQTTYVELKPRR